MADESISTAALTMDRGLTLGNSADTFARRALHTKIGNLPTEAIPVYLTTPAASSSVINAYAEITAVATNTETTVASYTVPADQSLFLSRAQYSGGNIATYRLKVDGVTIATQILWWTDGLSGELNFFSDQSTGLQINAGQVIDLTVIHQRPYVADFNGRIQGVLI